jgi:hypothetical protein
MGGNQNILEATVRNRKILGRNRKKQQKSGNKPKNWEETGRNMKNREETGRKRNNWEETGKNGEKKIKRN